MSTPDISRQIDRLIEDTEEIIKVYDSFKDLRDLPEAFQTVAKCLPVVEDTFRDAKMPAKKVKSDDAKALETRLDSCEVKTDKLKEIFRKMAKNGKDEYDSSLYRSIVVKLGKRRVETLMDDILEGLGALVADPALQAVMQKQVDPLAKAREELAEVPPSLPDSELDEQPGAATQFGDGNRQFNAFGSARQTNVEGDYAGKDIIKNYGTNPPGSVGRRGA